MGKLMFQWFYWHVLLPGRDIPGISTQMSMSGKSRPAAPIQEV
jgi:sulfide:quinone oxidoreductase